MKIKNPKTGEYVNIYSARLTFIKEKNGYMSKISKNVRVTICRYKGGPKERKDLPIPKEINLDALNWIREKIAVCNREDENDYVDHIRKDIPSLICHKLEDLVKDSFFGNSNKTKHKK